MNKVLYLCPLLICPDEDKKLQIPRREYELQIATLQVFLYRAMGTINTIDATNGLMLIMENTLRPSDIIPDTAVGTTGVGYIANLWHISFKLRNI